MKINYFLVLSLLTAGAFAQEKKEKVNPLVKPANELTADNILKKEKEFSIDPKSHLRTIGTGSMISGAGLIGSSSIASRSGSGSKVVLGLGVSGTVLAALGQKSFATGKDAMTNRKLIIKQLKNEALTANSHPELALLKPGGYQEVIKHFDFTQEKFGSRGDKSFYKNGKLNKEMATEYVSNVILKLTDLKEERAGLMEVGNDSLPGFFKTKISEADVKELLAPNYSEKNYKLLVEELFPIYEIKVIASDEENQSDDFKYKNDDARSPGKEFLNDRVQKAVEQRKELLKKAVRGY